MRKFVFVHRVLAVREMGYRVQFRSLRAARMLPLEFIDELPDGVPEFMLLPDGVEEPVLRVLPEPVVDDGLVVLEDDDEGMLLDPVGGVVVVVVSIVPVLLEGGVVVLPDGMVGGVVVVVLLLEPELDCAIAAPPAMSNVAAAPAVVVLKNEPMVMAPGAVETRPIEFPSLN